MINKSPFRYTSSLHKYNDPSCIARKESLGKVIELVEQGRYVQVLAPAQYGRSTFALQLADELQHISAGLHPFLPVLVRCLHAQGDDFKAIQNAMTESLLRIAGEFLPQDQQRKMSKLLGDVGDGTTYRFKTTLMEIERNTDRCVFVFIFDDLERLNTEVINNTLSLLRSFHEDYSGNRNEIPFRCIILSSRDLTHESQFGLSPFNVAETVRLPPLSREELAAMFDYSHTGLYLGPIRFNDKAREQLFTESGGHPYLIQRLCQLMLENAGWPDIKDEVKELTNVDVVFACIKFMEREDRNLSRLNAIMTNKEQQHAWILCKRLVKGENVRFAEVRPDVSLLASMGIIYDDKGFCRITANLYKRCLISLCFDEKFAEKCYAAGLEEWQQMLFSFPAVQSLLINSEFHHIVRNSDSFTQKTPDLKECATIVDNFLKEKNMPIEFDEVNVLLKYYGYHDKRQNDNEAILETISKWLVRAIQDVTGGISQ